MKFNIAVGDSQKSASDLLVLPLFDADLNEKKSRAPLLQELDKALAGALLKAAGEEGFKAKADQTWIFHTHGKLKADRVLLLGLGARQKFDPEVLRLAAGRASKAAVKLKAKDVSVVLPVTREFDQCVKATVEGFALGAYKFDRYKTQGKDEKADKVEPTVKLYLPAGEQKGKGLQALVDLAETISDATNWARDLVNEPGSVVTPARLADEAKKIAKEHGLKVTISGQKEIEKLKMGMFLAVAQGSELEPKLIHLVYTPKNAKDAKRPPVALIGKAITFDSGGLSLKPADGMIDMKTDMAGSAAVLGTMKVVASLDLPFPVHAFIGSCENMPSGTAYRPGDILISRLGKTVEVTNTDAEGRLVLGDVLTYAAEHKPAAMIDLATLTGACVVALGNHIVGAFGDDDALMWSVLEAAKAAGEDTWRLPIADAQKDALKSDVADMKNSGERWGGAINAAHFLREFVGEVPWVHLDIAGPSSTTKDRGYFAKGGTGVGVRTLTEYLRKRAVEIIEQPSEPEKKSEEWWSEQEG